MHGAHGILEALKLSYKSTIIKIKCHGLQPGFSFPRDLERDLAGQRGLGHFASIKGDANSTALWV